MAISLGTTGITFPDSTVQTTSPTGAYDHGNLLSISSYFTSGTYTWQPILPDTVSLDYCAFYNYGATIAVSGSNPYTMTQATVPNAWNSSIYTQNFGQNGNVAIQSQPSQTNTYIMFGLTRTPGASYTAIEYALYWSADGLIYIYESGTNIGSFGTYTTAYKGTITYDGSYIRYYASPDGKRPLRTVAVSNLTGFKGQWAFYNGGTLTNCGMGTFTNITAATALVKVQGGGGGAAGYCESGAAGGYSERSIDLSGVGNVTVTVGGGGAGVSYYAAGAAGSASSFGAYCSASGGGGSNSTYSHSGGIGGTGSGGNVNLQGSAGIGHVNSVGSHSGGLGGTGYWGGSAPFNRATATKVFNGAPGSGGPGGLTDQNNTGGAGMAGMVVVYAYK